MIYARDLAPHGDPSPRGDEVLLEDEPLEPDDPLLGDDGDDPANVEEMNQDWPGDRIVR